MVASQSLHCLLGGKVPDHRLLVFILRGGPPDAVHRQRRIEARSPGLYPLEGMERDVPVGALAP